VIAAVARPRRPQPGDVDDDAVGIAQQGGAVVLLPTPRIKMASKEMPVNQALFSHLDVENDPT
jgi:hypothetical protein